MHGRVCVIENVHIVFLTFALPSNNGDSTDDDHINFIKPFSDTKAHRP